MPKSDAEFAELAAALVAIDSVNPDLVPGGSGEARIAEYVEGWLRAAGLEVDLIDDPPGRPSVVGIARGSGGGRSLMLNAHLDTVGTAGMDQPFLPRREAGRLYGRGSYDTKGGLAACLWTARAAARRGWSGDLLIAAAADEEYASQGTEAVLRRYRADAAVVVEPTQLDLCVAHKGFVLLEVEAHGRAAHGSRPDLGVDAIAKMGAFLVQLAAHDQRLRREDGHPMLGTGSAHASLIRGGQEFSSYPARCTLGLERRTIPGEGRETVEEEMAALIERVRGSDADFVAERRTVLAREPFEAAPDAAIVRMLRRNAGRILGRDPALIAQGGWMDSSLMAKAGIETVVFGPGGEGAHAGMEWVDLESVRQCAEILHATAAEWCA
jgi:acetylornithine deacetylase